MSAAKEKSQKKRKKKLIIISIILAITVILYAWGFSLKTEKYSIETDKLDKGLTIAFISDLHNCFYGRSDQSGLMEEIENAEPDLVLFGGDVIDQYGGTEYALKIMKLAAEKYPCCYTPGNHEMLRDDMDNFRSDVTALGIHILEGEHADFTVNGQQVRVYGVLDSIEWGNTKTQLDECLDYLDNDYYNILLAHQPEQYYEYLGLDPNVLYESMEVTDSFDLILSGHAHGGQWRIPGILEQGLLAPDQGLFPDYTNGMYTYGNTVHIISRGLARPLRMIVIPRIFNRPELSIIEIMGV